MADHYVFARGDIDIASASNLAADLRRTIDTNDDDIVVDCDDCAFLGAAGISALIAAQRELEEAGRGIRIEHLALSYQRLLDLLVGSIPVAAAF